MTTSGALRHLETEIRALEEQGLKQPLDVQLGEQTLNEMCLGIFGILAPPGTIEQLF